MRSPVYILAVLYLYHYAEVFDLLHPTERCVGRDEMTQLGKGLPPWQRDMRIIVYAMQPPIIRTMQDPSKSLDDVLTEIDRYRLSIEQRQLVIHCAGLHPSQQGTPHMQTVRIRTVLRHRRGSAPLLHETLSYPLNFCVSLLYLPHM